MEEYAIFMVPTYVVISQQQKKKKILIKFIHTYWPYCMILLPN